MDHGGLIGVRMWKNGPTGRMWKSGLIERIWKSRSMRGMWIMVGQQEGCGSWWANGKNVEE